MMAHKGAQHGSSQKDQIPALGCPVNFEIIGNGRQSGYGTQQLEIAGKSKPFAPIKKRDEHNGNQRAHDIPGPGLKKSVHDEFRILAKITPEQ